MLKATERSESFIWVETKYDVRSVRFNVQYLLQLNIIYSSIVKTYLFLSIFGSFTILSADEMKILRSSGESEVVQKIHK